MDISSIFFNYEEADQDGKNVSVFLGDLPEEEWTRMLSVAQRRSFSAGEVLIRQGETSRAVYIVGSGHLEVYVNDAGGIERHIYDIEPLSVFGEQAFFDGLPRSANVRARDDGELFGITPEVFETLATRHPELSRRALLDLGRILSLRLRELTGYVLQRG